MASTIQTPQFKSVIMLNHDLISNKLKFGSNMTFHVRDVAWVKGKTLFFPLLTVYTTTCTDLEHTDVSGIAIKLPSSI